MLPPQSSSSVVLRVKRKRGDEPLDGLILPGSKRQVQIGDRVFRRVDTVASRATDELDLTKFSAPPLEAGGSQASDAGVARQYKVVGRERSVALTSVDATRTTMNIYDIQTEQTPFVYGDGDGDAAPPNMNEFISMVQEYLTLSEQPTLPEPTAASSDGDGYVYDIYVQDVAATANQQTGNLLPHFARLDWNGNEEFSLDSDGDDSSAGAHSDDSNAEDYYGNDYPDEEDLRQDSEDDAQDSDSSGDNLDTRWRGKVADDYE
ncbi:hypothetical protein RI367_008177 [Sorochytrium milnesiophthora]